MTTFENNNNTYNFKTNDILNESDFTDYSVFDAGIVQTLIEKSGYNKRDFAKGLYDYIFNDSIVEPYEAAFCFNYLINAADTFEKALLITDELVSYQNYFDYFENLYEVFTFPDADENDETDARIEITIIDYAYSLFNGTFIEEDEVKAVFNDDKYYSHLLDKAIQSVKESNYIAHKNEYDTFKSNTLDDIGTALQKINESIIMIHKTSENDKYNYYNKDLRHYINDKECLEFLKNNFGIKIWKPEVCDSSSINDRYERYYSEDDINYIELLATDLQDWIDYSTFFKDLYKFGDLLSEIRNYLFEQLNLPVIGIISSESGYRIVNQIGEKTIIGHDISSIPSGFTEVNNADVSNDFNAENISLWDAIDTLKKHLLVIPGQYIND